MVPRWTWCELARMGAVKVGLASCAFKLWTNHKLQRASVVASGPLMFRLGGAGRGNGTSVFDPQAGSFGFESVVVPYQAMFTRPSSPALIQAKTLLCNTPSGDPEVSIWL